MVRAGRRPGESQPALVVVVVGTCAGAAVMAAPVPPLLVLLATLALLAGRPSLVSSADTGESDGET